MSNTFQDGREAYELFRFRRYPTFLSRKLDIEDYDQNLIEEEIDSQYDPVLLQDDMIYRGAIASS